MSFWSPTWGALEAVTPEQVDKVGGGDVQVDVFTVQQHDKPESTADVSLLKQEKGHFQSLLNLQSYMHPMFKLELR